ncbi:MAG TPA: CDP-alcohol phosphatidyltransferase family protein [Candidatus Krumholzibacteria bacterium]|nr:CDP-alcohol phosphatidyltransferase family protein [Candidatus Krumholzibacteria bacterium]HPD72132.1 CDP-alcohol phosphatidyltransferase family protein [Candidatus Krumholzibacteria bacterium]HRY40936.1 CDP-alcohol phosphatidyltransferase family protein [Candidatus Krumholzibacteria bacterium]
MARTSWKETARAWLHPVVRAFDRLGFSPLAVTLTGLGISLLGAWLVAGGRLLWGTAVFLAGSGFDMFDGGLARWQGTASRRGAFLDSVFDRFGEAVYLTGLAVWFMSEQPANWRPAVVLVLVTMFGSLATSYVRARAEGVGETCQVGVLQRTERVLLLGLGGLLGGGVLVVVLAILAVLTLLTTLQRIVHVAAKLPGPDPAARRAHAAARGGGGLEPKERP